MVDLVVWDSPSAPSTRFVLEALMYAQDPANNRTQFQLYLRCINLGNTSSLYGGSGVQAPYIRKYGGGVESPGGYSANPFLPSGYPKGAQRWRFGPVYAWVSHGPNGHAPVSLGGGRYGFTIGQNIVYGSVNVNAEAVYEVPSLAQNAIERYDGSAYKGNVLERYDGSTWKRQILERYDGSTWKRQD